MFQSQQYGRMSMTDSDSNTDGPHEFHRAALYILGDKTQMKVIKFTNKDKCTKFVIRIYIYIIIKGNER